MEHLFKKLKSDRGATLIIALLFFMVCIMVASAIMTAAVANMGRIDKQRDEEQIYLAVFSAVRMLQDDFSDMTPCKAQKTDIEYTCNYNDEHPDIAGAWDCTDQDGNDTGSAGAILADYVNKAVIYVLRYNQAPDMKTFTITPDAPELSLIPVTVEMTMSKDYILKFALSAESASGSSYAVTLSIAGNASASSSVDSGAFCHHLEQSATPVLVNGEWVYPTIDNTYAINRTTYSTTVEWSPGTISKGR